MIEWWMVIIFVIVSGVYLYRGFNDFNEGMIAVPLAGISFLFAVILFLIKIFN